MAKFSNFMTNQDLENNGVWIHTGAEDDPEALSLKVARINNPKYNDHLRLISNPYQQLGKKMLIPQETMTRLVAEAMSYHVLKDWKNLQDDDGAEIPYSQEKAFELLMKSRDFHELVLTLASNANNFKDAVLKEQVGNSERS